MGLILTPSKCFFARTTSLKFGWGWGRLHNGTMDSALAFHPAAPDSIPGVPVNFYEFLMLQRLIDGAAAQSSGQQRLDNIDRTHLVLWLVASWYYKKLSSTNCRFAEPKEFCFGFVREVALI